MAIFSPAAMGQCDAGEHSKLTAVDAEAGDEFGSAVAISGDIAVVGANRDDTRQGGLDSGLARVYRFDGTQWNEEATLISSDIDEQDLFGWSVAISGDAILVGAIFEGASNSGAAYVFRFNGSEWVQEAKLTASDPAGNDHFGWSVSIRGDVAVVGAPSNTAQATGKAYVYRFNGARWIEEVKLLAFDGAGWDRFGRSVAISGEVAVIGAYNEGNSGPGFPGAGAAYVYRFDQQTGQWNGEGKLTPPPRTLPDWSDRFGQSVAIREDAQVMVIGTDPKIIAGLARPRSGVPDLTTYVYRFDPDACEGGGCSPWIKEAELMVSESEEFDRFGYAVSISGDVIVSGAWGEFKGECQIPQACNWGAAYVFRFDGADWIEEARVTSSDLADNDRLGWSVSVSGDVAVIGAPGNGDAGLYSGSAYVIGGLLDCNNNGVLDLCDIADGASDNNNNGVLDECECLGDVNGNGLVGAADLVTLLGAWGPNQGHPADLNGDDIINADDLALLLGNWGPCRCEGANCPALGKCCIPFETCEVTTIQECFGELGGVIWAPGQDCSIIPCPPLGACCMPDGACQVTAQTSCEILSHGTYQGDGVTCLGIACTQPCPADLDGDGMAGAADLAMLLENWGRCRGCPADLDGDGNIGANDLATLLSNWGPCA